MTNWLLSVFKRWPMWAFWISLFSLGLLIAIKNCLTTTDDLVRNQVDFKGWEPYCWELTSFAGIFLLFFAVYWLNERKPLSSPKWPQHLLFHVVASVVFSVLHVLFMVLFRQLIYAGVGMNYDFGNWSQELIYEYRKDVVTYFVFILSHSTYKMVLGRTNQQGTVKNNEIRFKNKTGWHRLLYSEIQTIESGGNYIYFNINGEVIPKRSTMKKISDSLKNEVFIRVHRSFIVNLDHIRALTELDKDPCLLVLNSGKTVPVSRKYRQNLVSAMEGVSQ